ncbi:hypothetical protein Zmor_004126 [Zophobas morio]|uniref:Uncharacterized protein n=1 Tax=Zophobas morio TaxID=2755281 RepID=A0AA38LZR8_9CUCU|nr:hypothetical protein Zmor_004126 [Zophobas morio]
MTLEKPLGTAKSSEISTLNREKYFSAVNCRQGEVKNQPPIRLFFGLKNAEILKTFSALVHHLSGRIPKNQTNKCKRRHRASEITADFNRGHQSEVFVSTIKRRLEEANLHYR